MPHPSSSSPEHISQSRHRVSDREIPAGQPYTSRAEEPIHPEGSVSKQTPEFLEELVHPRHHDSYATEDTLAEEEWSDEDERAKMRKLPWWRRPTPWWYVAKNTSITFCH
jgi:hypothetical protein